MLSFFEVDWADVVRQSVAELERREQRRQQRLAAEAAALEAGIVPTTARPTLPSCSPPPASVELDRPPPGHVLKALLLDKRLTPLERNTWQVLHHLLIEQGLAMPRYQDLQPYLATSPCGSQASRETIARALIVLRLTRWLTQVERARDEHGCLRGCVYRLHERPLTPCQALYLDPDYLSLVRQGLTHAAKGVRDVACHILGELEQDRGLTAEQLEPLRAAAQSFRQVALELAPPCPAIKSTINEHSERCTEDRVGTANAVVQDSESRPATPVLPDVRSAPPCGTVQEPKSSKKTVPCAQTEGESPHWPEALPLSAGERRQAARALTPLGPDVRQAVINEAAVRCASGGIRKPGAYLMGLIKRACAGEFTLWAAKALQSAPTAPKTSKSERSTPSPQVPRAREASPLAVACLNELKQRCRVMPHPA